MLPLPHDPDAVAREVQVRRVADRVDFGPPQAQVEQQPHDRQQPHVKNRLRGFQARDQRRHGIERRAARVAVGFRLGLGGAR